MIKVDQIERIRKLVHVKGLSERRAAKEAGVSRHAVRVALHEPVQRAYKLSRPKPRPVLDRVEALIAEMLRSDVGNPKKQQLRRRAKAAYI